MKLQKRGLILSAVVAGLMLPAAAQTSSTTPATPPPTINQRKENQQDRIANGVQNGSLTPGETANLEGKEAALNEETRGMRAADDGHLTAADKAKLNQQQNKLSNNISKDTHNTATDHFGSGEVGQRKENQQDRIAQGVKSGQLTPGETAKLEKQQQGIKREESGMREANGGKLTGADKKALNQQQNRASRNIYNKKHNGRKQ